MKRKEGDLRSRQLEENVLAVQIRPQKNQGEKGEGPIRGVAARGVEVGLQESVVRKTRLQEGSLSFYVLEK